MRWRIVEACIFFLSIAMIGSMSSGTAVSGVPKATAISVQEAEILAYVLPAAHRVRLAGRDVWIEPMPNVAHFNYSNCFYLYVSDPDSDSTGSILVGHYSVNKFAVEIWELGPGEGPASDDKEVQGVQRRLRKLHNIDQKQSGAFGADSCWIEKAQG